MTRRQKSNVMYGRPPLGKKQMQIRYSGLERSCIRPHMRASPSSYFFIGVLPSWLSAAHFNFLPRRSSHHKQGTSLQTSHPAGRRPHHGPAFGTGELQEGGNHSIRRRLTRQAGQRRRPLGSVCPCRSTARVPIRKVNQATGFITAPSGTTPWVANRHKAIRSRRAIATTMTLRMRFPVPPTRSRNQMT